MKPACHLPSVAILLVALAAAFAPPGAGGADASTSKAAPSAVRAALPAGVQAPGLDYYLPVDRADYDPAVPAPQQALGYQIGEWHAHHHEVVAYAKQVADASDRVTLTEYARSHGRRPLIHLTITAPENHARLEDIRKAHVARIESPAAAAISADAPIVVWMGYSVHGNEPSATNCSLLLAYHLAAARDAETTAFLKKAIVLLDPCLNPDGLERFAQWTNSHRGQFPSADRADREHQEGWPTGRSNYYWFDLNRDWLPAVHPESQGRLRLFHHWQPNIVTDYHEMGNNNRSYFFQPGIAKMVHPLTPPQNQALTEKMAKGHAAALDGIGSLYYTGESYDDFYIGKGSTYPDLNGSVGVLFEQASSRGFHQDTEHGRLTFPFTIRNQLLTSLSTLRSAAKMRTEFLQHQKSFFDEALKAAAASETKAYAFSAPGDPARLAALQTLLQRHQIRFFRPAADVTAGEVTFSAGDTLVVPVQQRQFRLLTAMFEKRTAFESNIFYDVSAWRIPSAFGLLEAELPTVPEAAAKPEVPLEGAVRGPGDAYAYVFSWEPRLAPRAVFKLLQSKVRCWVATRSFQTTAADGAATVWPHGTIVVPAGVQDQLTQAGLRDLMQTVAQEAMLDVQALSTGYHGSVPDLGSPTFEPLKHDGVLLLVGPGVGSPAAGDVWHQFDQVWNTSLTMAEAAQVSPSLLRSFSTVILANASFSGLPAGARTALQNWVTAGGCLVAIGSVSSLAAEEWCKIETVKAATESAPKGKPSQETRPYDEAAERRAGTNVDGVILRAHFDPTHPLAYGLGRRPLIHLMRDGTTYLKASPNVYLNPLQYTDDPLVSGSASQANQDAMKKTTPVQIKVVGSGRVVFMTDNPVFRGHWLGTEKLLANAVLFGGLVSSGGGSEDAHEH